MGEHRSRGHAQQLGCAVTRIVQLLWQLLERVAAAHLELVSALIGEVPVIAIEDPRHPQSGSDHRENGESVEECLWEVRWEVR